jgi:PAS domain-containing protein
MERSELDQWKAKEVARLLALVETERRYYQDVIATLPVGLLVVSADFRVISANRAFRRTFKLRTEDVLHHDLREVLRETPACISSTRPGPRRAASTCASPSRACAIGKKRPSGRRSCW